MPSYTSEELKAMRAKGEDLTDWKKVDAMSDDAVDDSDIPEDFWENAVVVYPTSRKHISFRMEDELLSWYREEAKRKRLRGYQSLMHSVLLSYKNEQERKTK